MINTNMVAHPPQQRSNLEEKKASVPPSVGEYDDRLVIDKADLMKKFELHFPKPKTRKAYKGHLEAWLK